MKNYIDVDALVTERLLLQESLKKNMDELYSMNQKYLEVEIKLKSLLRELSAEKCDSLEDFLATKQYFGGLCSASTIRNRTEL